MRTSWSRSRSVSAAGAALISAMSIVAIPALASPAAAATAAHGYSTGDVVFADAVNVPQINVAKVSVANSAAVAGNPLATKDDLQQPLYLKDVPAGATALGHAAGINLGLLQAYDAAPQAQLTIAEAASPPPKTETTSLIDLSDTPLKPLVSAVVQPDIATAQSTADQGICVLGDAPISGGQANVAQAQVLNVDNSGTAVNVVSVDNAVKSTSSMSLAQASTAPGKPTTDKGLALVGATRIDPTSITLFRGTPAQLTIKVLQPLTLAAVAGPTAATTYHAFTVENPGAPVLSVTTPDGSTQTLNLQDITGSSGIHIGLGIADVTIGTPATVSHPDGATSIKAVADLIHVQLLAAASTSTIGVDSNGPLAPLTDGLNQVAQGLSPVLQPLQDALNQAGVQTADVRIGHFESLAAVPAGGVQCADRVLKATKTANPTKVTAGQSVDYTITFENPYSDCTVKNATITDAITGSTGVKWTVTSPAGSANDKITWSGVTIPPKGKKTVTATIKVAADSAGGTITDTATISGQCVGSSGAATDVTGGVNLNVGTGAAGGPPSVGATGSTGPVTVTVTQVESTNTQQPAGPTLAMTGGSPLLPLAGLGLVGAAAVLRRRFRGSGGPA